VIDGTYPDCKSHRNGSGEQRQEHREAEETGLKLAKEFRAEQVLTFGMKSLTGRVQGMFDD